MHPNYQPAGSANGNGSAGKRLGWVSDDDAGYPNKATRYRTLREVYQSSDPFYTGKWTVPCLYDTRTGKVVNHESSHILDMMNGPHLHPYSLHWKKERIINLRPPELLDEIQRLADWLYLINNGVYQRGFAQSQQA